jgi:hypothetical protein
LSRGLPSLNSLPNGTKRGRPEDPALALYRQLFPEWSPRTIARYAGAMRRLDVMGYSDEQSVDVLRLVTGGNGTINVARLDRLTENRSALALASEWTDDDAISPME